MVNLEFVQDFQKLVVKVENAKLIRFNLTFEDIY